MRTRLERLAWPRLDRKSHSINARWRRSRGAADKRRPGLIAKTTQFRMIRVMLFHRVASPWRTSDEPVPDCPTVRVSWSGRYSRRPYLLAERDRTVEGGVRGFEIAGAIISKPPRYSSRCCTFGIRFGRFEGQ